jgi:hypothetical protein
LPEFSNASADIFASRGISLLPESF